MDDRQPGWSERSQRTNELARRVLALGQDRVGQMAAELLPLVAAEIGEEPVPLEAQWPADIPGLILEYMVSVTADDVGRLGRPGGSFERLGGEAARGGLDLALLERGVRIAVRRLQSLTPRVIVKEGLADGPDEVVDLLARGLGASEVVIGAIRRGYELRGEEDDLARRLASVLLHDSGPARELIEAVGWPADSMACVILADRVDAAAIRATSQQRLAYYPRAEDVVLVHPVAAGSVATVLRRTLAPHRCIVGQAVPLDSCSCCSPRWWTDPPFVLGRRGAEHIQGGYWSMLGLTASTGV